MLFCQSLRPPVNDRMTNDHGNHDHVDQTSNDRYDPEDHSHPDNTFLNQMTDNNDSQILLTEVSATSQQISR